MKLKLHLALLPVIAACAVLNMAKFQEPSIQLNSLVVRSVGLQGGALAVLLDINNPNSFDLRGTRLTLGLDVERTHFGDVVLNDAFALPKGVVTTLTVPLTFEWAGVGAAARSIFARGTVSYHMVGDASLTTPYGTGRVPFSRDGRVSLVSGR